MRAALLRKLTTDTPEGIKLRDLIWPLEDSPVLPRPLLDMLDDLALRQCAPTGAAISLVLPFLKETRVTLQLMDRGEKNSYTLQALAKAEPELRARLAELLVSGRAHMVSPRKDAAKTERCVLTCSAPWPVRPHALRQIQCLEYLAVHGATNRRTLIRVLGGKGKEIVDSLATLGLLRIESDDGLEEAEAILRTQCGSENGRGRHNRRAQKRKNRPAAALRRHGFGQDGRVSGGRPRCVVTWAQRAPACS